MADRKMTTADGDARAPRRAPNPLLDELRASGRAAYFDGKPRSSPVAKDYPARGGAAAWLEGWDAAAAEAREAAVLAAAKLPPVTVRIPVVEVKHAEVPLHLRALGRRFLMRVAERLADGEPLPKDYRIPRSTPCGNKDCRATVVLDENGVRAQAVVLLRTRKQGRVAELACRACGQPMTLPIV